ncbi:MAG: hypothetical protein J6R39_03650, partial [Oscillospiraceae bacterium]|nr:hypothetical protein [Oscillospiraceae bacterium]
QRTAHYQDNTQQQQLICAFSQSAQSAANCAARCPPRPGVVARCMAHATARNTSAGFCRVVAALSR